MELKELMENHGFTLFFSGEGCEWYARKIQYEGKEAIAAISDGTGLGVPSTTDEPVLLRVFDMEGGMLTPARKVKSLAKVLALFEKKVPGA